MKFVDQAKIVVCSGDGGSGHVGFRTEKMVPKGGPDGGNGGNGGDVILVADSHLTTLLDFRYKRSYKADDGKKGMKSRKTGKSANHLYIRLPQGTIVKNALTDEFIVDLSEKGQEYIVCKGGKGGLGNAEFATATNQTPLKFKPGRPGIELEVKFELKLIADVGLVGFPNAGKSTLISVISAAKPKIADYPFTTLIPNLGIVNMGDYQNFTVADIPGLIEGACDGKGLGLQFLRHVERTRVLVFLLDASSKDLVDDYKVLYNELIKFNPEMAKKNRIICISKIDIIPDEFRQEFAELDFGKQDNKVMMISSVINFGMKELKHKIWEIISKENELFDSI